MGQTMNLNLWNHVSLSLPPHWSPSCKTQCGLHDINWAEQITSCHLSCFWRNLTSICNQVQGLCKVETESESIVYGCSQALFPLFSKLHGFSRGSPLSSEQIYMGRLCPLEELSAPDAVNVLLVQLTNTVSSPLVSLCFRSLRKRNVYRVNQ